MLHECACHPCQGAVLISSECLQLQFVCCRGEPCTSQEVKSKSLSLVENQPSVTGGLQSWFGLALHCPDRHRHHFALVGKLIPTLCMNLCRTPVSGSNFCIGHWTDVPILLYGGRGQCFSNKMFISVAPVRSRG